MDQQELKEKLFSRIINKTPHVTPDMQAENFIRYTKLLGTDKACIVAMEECAELTQAISKMSRDQNHDHMLNLMEEIADVQMSIDQLIYMFDLKKDEIRHIQDIKYQRVKDKLDNNTFK